MLSKDEKKDWNIMPLFELYFFLLNLKQEERIKLYKLLKNLFICSFSYSKVVEADEKFNPAINIESVANNFSVTDFYNEHDNYETPDSFNFIMNELMNKMFESDESKDKIANINNSIENMDSNNLDTASNNIKNILNENGKNNSTELLSSMLDMVKNEIGDLKHNKSNNIMKDLMNIGKKISIDFKNNQNNKDVDPRDLLKTAFGLAKKATGNDNLDVIEKILENTITDQINSDIEKKIINDTLNNY